MTDKSKVTTVGSVFGNLFPAIGDGGGGLSGNVPHVDDYGQYTVSYGQNCNAQGHHYQPTAEPYMKGRCQSVLYQTFICARCAQTQEIMVIDKRARKKQ